MNIIVHVDCYTKFAVFSIKNSAVYFKWVITGTRISIVFLKAENRSTYLY